METTTPTVRKFHGYTNRNGKRYAFTYWVGLALPEGATDTEMLEATPRFDNKATLERWMAANEPAFRSVL